MNGGSSSQGSLSTATTKTMTSQPPAASRMGTVQPPYSRRTPKRKAKLEASVTEPIVVSALDFRVPSFNQNMACNTGSGPAISPLPSSPHSNQPSKDKTASTKTNQATAASSFPSPPADSSFAHFSKNPAVIQAEAPKAPALDMSTVKTTAPRNPQPRTEPRAFGLQEAPTFYPTWDEFKDPMAYVAKIISEYGAEKYGIAKIVPPNGWQPPFVLDTEKFRFKTRLMRLNSIEAKSRAKINFFEQLVMFHQQQGNPRLTVPVVNHKDVDLWLLRKEVNRLGGYEQVTKNKNWAEIAHTMGTSQPFAHSIRNVYTRVILPFEQYVARAKTARSPPKPTVVAPIPSNSTSSITPTSNMVAGTPSGKAGNDDRLPPTPISTGGRPVRGAAQKKMFSYDEDGDSSLSEPDSDTDADLSRPVSAPPLSKSSSSFKKEIPIIKGEQCEVCCSGAHGTKILLCDGCDRGYHIYCLDPPLSAVPKNESWFCSVCLMNAGAEFGFDEGEEHTLSSFQARDTAFRNHWWATHPPKKKTQPPVPLNFSGGKPVIDDKSGNQPNGETQKLGGVDVSEHDVEMEFWRLVESQTETVEVEYGADVHVMMHGSGAPTTETHPLEPYSVDQWNLNVMPIVPDSVLRYIKTNISGMTVPWIYVGFAFSAFCWHNEDHHTSSVNYMHWGETKTWYGVPGDYSSAFEEAMKSEAPDLFEQQPSLLFQLITLMSPGRIMKAGVPVYACDQRPNEFVVTFPRAYHAGFNHGLNYNEAVNFAHPEWLEHGLGCVQNYKKYNKPPVFSHDELLVSIETHSKSIKTAIWLKPHIEEMVTRELKARAVARIQLSTLSACEEEIQPEDLPEEEYQCSSCKAYCYLAQIRCSCMKEIACLDHASELCGCTLDKKSLRLRFTDDALLDMQKQVSDRAAIPEVWKAKLVNAVFESKRPSLRQLRALVAEGKQISHILPDLAPLEVFVERANEMVLEASSFTVRKLQSRKPSRKSRSVGAGAEEDPTAGEDFMSKPGIDAVVDLLSQVETFGFEAPEITALENFLATALEFQYRASNSLSIPDEQQSITDCEVLFNSGLALGLNLPELQAYSRLVHRLRWVRDLEEVDETMLEMKDIDAFIERAQAYQVQSDHPFVLDLQAKKVSSHSWAGDADQIFGSNSANMTDLEALLARSRSVAVDADRLHRLQLLRSRVIEAERNVRSMLDSLASSSDRVSVTRDAQRLINRFEAKGKSPIPVSGMEELKHEVSAYGRFFDELNAIIKPETSDKSLADQLRALEVKVTTQTDPADDLPFNRPTPSVSSTTNTPEDANLFAPFACVCRLPEGPDMIICTRCTVAYHSACIGSIQAEPAEQPYLCFVCEPSKVDLNRPARPTLADLIKLVRPELHTFRHPLPEVEMLTTIIDKITRFADFLTNKLRSISPRTTSNAEEALLLRHFLRKVEGIWVDIQTSHTGDAPTSLRPAIIATLTALEKNEPAAVANMASVPVPVVPQEKKRVRNRKPKWEIIQETPPHDQGCICRLPREETLVTCSNARCARGYHPSCVHIKPADFPLPKFKCPLCCIQTGTRYRYAICLLQMKEHEGTRQFVNVKATLNALDTLTFLDLEILEGRPYIFYTAKTFHPGFKSEIEEGTEPPPVKRKKSMVESLESGTNSPVGETPPTRSVPKPPLSQIVPPPPLSSSSSSTIIAPSYVPPPFSPSCFQPPPLPPPPSCPPSYYPSHPFSNQSYLTYQALPPPSSVPPRFYSSHSQYYPLPAPLSTSSSSHLSHLLNPIQEPLPSSSVLLPPTPAHASLVTPSIDSMPIPVNLPVRSEPSPIGYESTGLSMQNNPSGYREPDPLPSMKKAETGVTTAGSMLTTPTVPDAVMKTPDVEAISAPDKVARPSVSPATGTRTSASPDNPVKSLSEISRNGPSLAQ